MILNIWIVEEIFFSKKVKKKVVVVVVESCFLILALPVFESKAN
jgi:hypothetical protein